MKYYYNILKSEHSEQRLKYLGRDILVIQVKPSGSFSPYIIVAGVVREDSLENDLLSNLKVGVS